MRSRHPPTGGASTGWRGHRVKSAAVAVEGGCSERCGGTRWSRRGALPATGGDSYESERGVSSPASDPFESAGALGGLRATRSSRGGLVSAPRVDSTEFRRARAGVWGDPYESRRARAGPGSTPTSPGGSGRTRSDSTESMTSSTFSFVRVLARCRSPFSRPSRPSPTRAAAGSCSASRRTASASR